jgi:acyl-CoA reductase-like NAD-dependent aldehyde dehydrogenase
MEAAARSNLKDVTLEMGGKSPVVVFADANLPKAAALAIKSITFSKL